MLYCGEKAVNKVRRVKVELDQILPTLLTAERPWSLPPSPCPSSASSPSLYFEVTVMSEAKRLSIGLTPLLLPPAVTGAAPAASSSGLPLPSFAARHLYGWAEGSVLYTQEGRKARFWHAVKNPYTDALHVHDLCDVKDLATGKWHQAVVVGESERSLEVHFLQWDDRYDEQLDLGRNDRVDTFLSHTRFAHRAGSDAINVSGQLWHEPYGPPFSVGDTVGCGFSAAHGGVYFTLNGQWLGIAYCKELAPRMFPAVCLHDGDTQVTANFSGPFLYNAREDGEGEDVAEPSNETQWAHGVGTDIASSLQVFNDPRYSLPPSSASLPRRLLPYQPLPAPAVYRRWELACDMQALDVFPDLTIAQMMRALEMTGDDYRQAVELCYLQSSLLTPPADDGKRKTSTPSTASLFSPAPRTSFGYMASASSSSFFSGPFNTAAASGARAPRFSLLPSRRSLSTSSVGAAAPAADDVDGFDDLMVDDGDDSDPHTSSAGLAADHAYSLSSLSSLPRTVNDFLVGEHAEMQASTSSERSRMSLDPSSHPAIELFGLLQEGLRGQGQSALNFVELLEALRTQLGASEALMLFARGGRPPLGGERPGPLALMSPEPSLKRSELMVGVTVRVSSHAKAACIGRVPTAWVRNDVAWSEEMDECVGRVGLITAVDRRAGLVLVRINDVERGLFVEQWFPPHVLVRLIALRCWGYSATSNELVCVPHLVRVQSALIRQLSRRLLLSIVPQLAELLSALRGPGHQSKDEVEAHGGNGSSSLGALVSAFARDAMLVWTLPELQRFATSDLQVESLVQPPFPYTAVAPGPTSTAAVTSYLARHYPHLALKFLRHTQDMLQQHSVELEYSSSTAGTSATTPPLASSSSPTASRTLLYRCVHVPQASALVVSFTAKVTLSSHAVLSFYRGPHHQRLLFQFQGQRASSQSSSTWLPPLVLSTNAIWVHLAFDGQPTDQVGDVSLLITPISEQMSAGLSLSQQLVADVQRGDRAVPFLRPLFDQCVDLLTSGKRPPPAFVRIPVLRLTTALLYGSARGTLGDMCAALPLFREMVHAHREKEPEDRTDTPDRGRAAERRRQTRVPPMFSPLLQHLVELHCAVVEHFHPRRAPPFAAHPRGAGGDEEEKQKRGEDGQLDQVVGARDLYSPPAAHGVSGVSEVMLDPDYRWPEWFVSACSAVLSLRSVLAGGVWKLSKPLRRDTALGVVSLVPGSMGGDEEDDDMKGEDAGIPCLTLSMYEQLALYMEKRAEQVSRPPLQLTVDDLTGDEAGTALSSFPRAVQSLPLPLLLLNATHLQALNVALSQALPLFDLSSPSPPSSICALLSHCRHLLFFSVKSAFLYDAMAASSTPSSAASGAFLSINRLRAAHSARSASRHQDTIALTADTVVGQSFAQLRGVPGGVLRRARPRGGAPHTAFHVQFEGESVLGQGGPYRQLFSDVTRELQSTLTSDGLRLFVPTPNARSGVGENRHLFMPNPAMTSVQQLLLFEHVGRLMGAACRTRLLLSLELPVLFWRLLTGDRPTRVDLAQVDTALVDGLLVPGERCYTEEEFQALFGSASLTFPVTRSDGVPVKPAPLEAVTLATLPRWLAELEEARLSETRAQVEAVRRGLASLVPLAVLRLFSPAEVCRVFCGSATIDVALLQRHTEYSGGLSESAPHIAWFWRALREMTDAQRRQFVAFAYAQERLPADDAAFNSFPSTRMLLKPGRLVEGADIDHQLPHSDTYVDHACTASVVLLRGASPSSRPVCLSLSALPRCFFNVEVPAYSSFEVMRERLLQVCEMGQWGLSGDDNLPELAPLPSLNAGTGPRQPASSASSSASPSVTAGTATEMRPMTSPAVVSASTASSSSPGASSSMSPSSTTSSLSSLIPFSSPSRRVTIDRVSGPWSYGDGESDPAARSLLSEQSEVRGASHSSSPSRLPLPPASAAAAAAATVSPSPSTSSSSSSSFGSSLSSSIRSLFTRPSSNSTSSNNNGS